MPRGVKKVVEEVKEEAKVVEEVAEQPAVEEVKEEKAEEPVVEEAKEELQELVADAAAEEPVVEAEIAVEAVVDEAEPDAIASTPAEELKKEESAASEWQFVENLRIYPRPADLKVVKIITGNIKVIGTVGEMKKIQYLKHGFGLVEALTDAI